MAEENLRNLFIKIIMFTSKNMTSYTKTTPLMALIMRLIEVNLCLKLSLDVITYMHRTQIYLIICMVAIYFDYH